MLGALMSSSSAHEGGRPETVSLEGACSVMEAGEREGGRFIGIIEGIAEGWRASFRLWAPGEAFTRQDDTEFFATELQAKKWLHTQRPRAASRPLR